ncbi:hypothetical protein AVO41_08230 [Thiomicrospira sp. WB1]|nr:hypothetical protein AVO41_08230 [Thiomicrospira sp. WB1]
MKQNLWRLFVLIASVSLVLLLVSMHQLNKTVWDKAEMKMLAYAKIISSAGHEIFIGNEALLDILGSRLIENQYYKNIDYARSILRRTLENQPYVLAFGLLNPEGEYIAVSSNLENQPLPNLARQPQTAKNFELTLNSDRMIIGDAYIFKPLQQWIVPIRKALRNKEGEVIAVMAAALRLDDQALLNKVAISQDQLNAIIINERSGRRLMMSGISLSEGTHFYGYTYLTAEKKRFFDTQVQEKYNQSLAQKLQSEDPFVVTGISEKMGEEIIVGAQYDKDFDLIYAMYEPLKTYQNEITYGALKNFLIYLVLMMALWVIFRTIEKQETNIRKKLTFQAMQDSVADLPNRNYVDSVLKKEFEDNARQISVIYIDLDNFKNINDTFGHAMGDRFIASIAQVLKNNTGKLDHVVRFGADEFLVFTNQQDALRLAHFLQNCVSHPIDIDGNVFAVTASIGLAEYPQQASSLNELIGCADIAMQAAKKTKDAVIKFHPSMQDEVLNNALIELNMRKGLEKDEFFIQFQPQFKQNGSLCGFEALARWKNDELGLVPPDRFIRIAEESGFMPTLGEHLLHKTLQGISKIQAHFQSSLMFSINLSVRQLMVDGFNQRLMREVIARGINPAQLMLEVTESIFIQDKSFVHRTLSELKEASFKLSVDDFGTGYSSLSMLSEFPIDELKIDRSFVVNLKKQQNKELVSSIIMLGKHLGLHVISEGVEQRSEIDVLNTLGCDCYQGYYYSKPLSLSEILASNFATKND